jgi:hypothetical protein
MKVTPSWVEAPGIDGSDVTIVFVFVSKWKKVAWEPECKQKTKALINSLVGSFRLAHVL